MNIEKLPIEGAFVITPRQFPDGRGVFMEGFRGDRLAEHLGHRMDVIQSNISVSAKGTLRGIHFADVPPSQAKYITVLSGSIIDFIVDIRVGSPTFGEWTSVVLDTKDRKAVYLAEGLGHAFVALEDDSTAMYLCSAPYTPEREHGINPLDAEVALSIPDGLDPILSPKDEAAPTLAEAKESGLLPKYEDCVKFYESLRD